ncbi:MAG: hypothetical protein RSD99_03090, partial [Janthinobacterium sp.]
MMAETATTVEILISIGFCDGLLDINIYQSETAAGQMFRTATIGSSKFLAFYCKKISVRGLARAIPQGNTYFMSKKTGGAP